MKWIEDIARKFRLSDSSTATLEDIERIVREEKAMIVFSLRRPSHLECAVVRELCRIRGLPLPQGDIAADDYDETATFLFLRRRLASDSFRYFANRYREQIERKLTSIKRLHSSRPIIVVPCSLFAGLGPRPWPPQFTVPIDSSLFPIYDLWESGRYLYLSKSLTLELGPLIELDAKLSPRSELRQVAKELYRKEKTMRGARALKGSKVEQIVLSGESFDRTLEQIAIHQSLSRYEVMERARHAYREIAGVISGVVLEFFRLVLVPTVRKLFKHIDVRGLEHIRAACAQGPVVLVSTHRSHFDYLLHGFVLYHNGVPLPYIAAGKNLDFFPAGPLLRRSGAFFIRRKIENDPLYKVVLERYLTYLIKQGHLIEFYIEGGRSRSGHTLPPRFGLLKSMIRTLSRGERRDILLVPAAVSYERVPEDRSLARERFGASKVKENLRSLFKARSVFSKRFGPVFVQFGEPISLRQALHLNGFNAETSPVEKKPKAAAPRDIEQLGARISGSLNDLQALSTSALLSAATLLSPSQSLSIHELLQNVDAVLRSIAWGRGLADAQAPDFFRNRSWQTADRHFCGISIGLGVSQLLDNDLREDILRQQCEWLASIHELSFENDILSPIADDFVVLDFYRNAVLPRIFAAGVATLRQAASAESIAAKIDESLHAWFRPTLHLPPYQQLAAAQSPLVETVSRPLSGMFYYHIAALLAALRLVGERLESTSAATSMAFRREIQALMIAHLRSEESLRSEAQTDTMTEFVGFVLHHELFLASKHADDTNALPWKELVRERTQRLRTTLAQLHLAIRDQSKQDNEERADYLIHPGN